MEMKVKLTRGILHEKEHYDAGQVLELSNIEAQKLFGMGKLFHTLKNQLSRIVLWLWNLAKNQFYKNALIRRK